MKHSEVRDRIAGLLLDQPGWEQNPRIDHDFRHPHTGVHVLVYEAHIKITFGHLRDSNQDQAVTTSTRFFPNVAIASAVEIAEAMVAARQPRIDVAHLARQREFSERTFGPGARTAMVIDHIRKELAEVEAEPAVTALGEWVDVIILALDGAWRSGHEPQEILKAIIAKQARNEARTWPDWRTASADRAIEHDRSKD